MANSLERLLAIGFRFAGHWSLANDVLRLNLEQPLPAAQELLYAFAVGGDLTYVGKTTQGLLRRMQAYRSPASNAERGGSTNIKNNRNIRAALGLKPAVDIYVLNATGEQLHGEFRLNLAAGLEDSLIRELAPPWNRRTLAAAPSVTSTTTPTTAVGTLALPQSPPSGPADVLPTTAELFAFCRARQGQTFATAARGREFQVAVEGDVLRVTPTSSGRPRPVREENVRAFLERLNASGSSRSTDYQDLTFHASYVLALVKEWRSQAPAG